MKVLLVNPPSMVGDYNATELSPTYNDIQHAGIAYIGGMLERKGQEVTVIECDCEKVGVNELMRRIKELTPDCIGFSVYYYNYDNVIKILNLLDQIKSWKPYIFAGGYYASLEPEKILNRFHNVKCCVIGEGEYTVTEIVEAVKLNKSIKEVKGIAYIENEDVIFTPQREVELDLHAFDFPKVSYISKSKNAGVVTSRGCLGSCSFCSINSYYKKLGYPIRYRNAESIVNEIEQLVNKGVTNIQFLDDNFLFHIYSKEKTLLKLCEMIKEKDIHIKIYIYARTKEIIKGVEELKGLKSIGLSSLFVGVESFVDRQLKLYNKKTTAQENKKAIRILNELELPYTLGLILFDPYVTVQELDTNLDALLELEVFKHVHDLDYPISISTQLGVIPNTELYYKLEKEGVLDEKVMFGFTFVNEEMKLYLASIKNWQDNIRRVYFLIQALMMETGNPLLYDLKKELLLKDIEFLKYMIKNYRVEDGYKAWISYLNNVEERINPPIVDMAQ